MGAHNPGLSCEFARDATWGCFSVNIRQYVSEWLRWQDGVNGCSVHDVSAGTATYGGGVDVFGGVESLAVSAGEVGDRGGVLTSG